MGRGRTIVLAGAVAAAWWGFSLPAVAQATSASYRLQPVSINAGASPATSAANRLDASFGQGLTVGGSSAPHFILQSAF